MDKKRVLYRVPHTFDEGEVNEMCGVAYSQLQYLVMDTVYKYVEFVNHSFMKEAGSHDVSFVVKHKLSNDTDGLYCYSVFGQSDCYDVPKYFGSCYDQEVISMSEIEKSHGLANLDKAVEDSESCNYQFFI